MVQQTSSIESLPDDGVQVTCFVENKQQGCNCMWMKKLLKRLLVYIKCK